MYQLDKKCGTQNTYSIVMRSTVLGTVSFTPDTQKWTARIGKLKVTQKSRKAAVEGALYQIITNQVKGERL